MCVLSRSCRIRFSDDDGIVGMAGSQRKGTRRRSPGLPRIHRIEDCSLARAGWASAALGLDTSSARGLFRSNERPTFNLPVVQFGDQLGCPETAAMSDSTVLLSSRIIYTYKSSLSIKKDYIYIITTSIMSVCCHDTHSYFMVRGRQRCSCHVMYQQEIETIRT